eukprot:9154275-Pyramimonas_sp.AAC.1
MAKTSGRHLGEALVRVGLAQSREVMRSALALWIEARDGPLEPILIITSPILEKFMRPRCFWELGRKRRGGTMRQLKPDAQLFG